MSTDPTLIDDERAMFAFLDELERSESGVFAAAGGPAPLVWTEMSGAPARTRGGIPRIYGRVERVKGAE